MLPRQKEEEAMLFIYHTVEDKLLCTTEIAKGCWINLINPTEAELLRVSQETELAYDFLKYPLDDEELPRVETDEDQIMIIVNIPIICKGDVVYDTIPLGIILNDNFIVTVCLEDANLLQEFTTSRVKGIATFKKTRFIFHLLHRKTTLFLKYLRDINRLTEETEKSLRSSMKNQSLFYSMNLQKSLVYFSTSLRYNAKVMSRLMRGKTVKMYEEDEDLLEDVIIENTQAIEMADIYSNISSTSMTAFASLISNNLTIVMKFLTAITIILSIPTMLASFWGMNVPVPFGQNLYGFTIILSISLVICLISTWLLIKKHMF